MKDVNEYIKDHIFEQFKYMIFHIFIYILHFYGYVTNSQSDHGLMVCAFDFGSSGPGSSPDQGHCVLFLGNETHDSHRASLHPGV